MSAERADVGAARTEAEQLVQLGHSVPHATLQALLSGLHHAEAEIVQLRDERDQWQDAYCEARLELRRRDAQPFGTSRGG